MITINGDGNAIVFHFRVVPLWRVDGRKYFEQRIVSMFAFLPAMGGVTTEMLFQSLEFMVQFYRDKQDEAGLHEEMIAFVIMLRRARLLARSVIEEVTMKMVYHDPFIEEDPFFAAIINERAEERAEKRAQEVRAKELASSKNALLRFVEEHYPTLGTDTIHAAVLPDNRNELDILIFKVATAPDEETVCRLLGISAN